MSDSEKDSKSFHDNSQLQDSLSAYLKEISKYNLLTAEQEIELSNKIRKGDNEARIRMINSNLRLVVSIARQYSNNPALLLDLIEEGNLGLLKAVEKFDPAEGCRFSTYASWWIKQTIYRAISYKLKNVRIPSYMTELMKKWKSLHSELSHKLNRSPSAEEIIEQLDITTRQAKVLMQAMDLSSAVGETHKIAPFMDIEDIPDQIYEEQKEDDYDLISNFNRKNLDKLLERLTKKERLVIDLRYGLDNKGTRTLQDIAEKLDITRERVRQIEQKGIRKIQKYLSRMNHEDLFL